MTAGTESHEKLGFFMLTSRLSSKHKPRGYVFSSTVISSKGRSSQTFWKVHERVERHDLAGLCYFFLIFAS